MNFCSNKVLACFGLALFLWTSCTKETSKRDIRVKHEFSPILLINPHASTSTTLVVNGKEFRGVTGVEPFFLEITNRNAILFVTRDSVIGTLHIFDFDRNSVVSVNLGAVSFGDAIGLNKGGGRDFIESLTSDHLAVASKFLDRKTVWHVDLRRRVVTHKEVFDFDKRGIVTNRTVVSL